MPYMKCLNLWTDLIPIISLISFYGIRHFTYEDIGIECYGTKETEIALETSSIIASKR